MFARSLLVVVAAIGCVPTAAAQIASNPLPNVVRTEDVIYGRRDGVALTMDVFAPKVRNGAGIIVCVSAEFKSGKEMIDKTCYLIAPEFLKRGYVVFMVAHGSQPRFPVPDIVDDMHHAVRFIKANAGKFGVDPDRLGITGASSGGQLCLMMGCTGKIGDPRSPDPIEKQTSKVAAVACIFPLSNFLEFDRDDLPPKWARFRALFDIREFNAATNQLEGITAKKRTELGREYSPVFRVGKGAAPTFIVHGDADGLIPVRQSRDLIAAMKKCDVTCDYLEVKGMGHTAIEALAQLPKLGAWFDKQLLKK